MLMRIRIPNALRDALLGRLAVGLIKLIRLTDPHKMSDLAGRVMRKVGPKLREHRIGRANLKLAFPDKTDAEIETILAGVWDNLGRLGIEFAHLDRIWDHDPDNRGRSRIEFAPESEERFIRLRDDGKPALVFAAHLANWEMPALPGAAHGLPSAVLYRAPNIGPIADMVLGTRGVNMGRLIKTGLDAPVKAAEALQEGLHVGMLVDQYYVRGVPVTFFGHKTNANPLIARLARQIECPIHGVRVVRLPDHRFFIELTEEIAPARDAEGKIDVTATMQIITGVVEGWVREHPGQWLWLHRRWR
ncbi:MAG: lipid A biosynthesis lauroyl acyltransferase [Pseudorhodoplanes sp.]|nr:MAG: lipid A biosynthesis lauroyl acyltransferase [Pseudorhodoplanes sp.]